MARSFQILSVMPASTGSPARIEVSGDQTSSFQGKFYRQIVAPNGTQPFYTGAAPVGYSLIKATTFEIVENVSYNGRYTVYTQASNIDPTWPSWFDGVSTSIAVNELIAAPIPANASDALLTGRVVNISTYDIRIVTATASTSLIVPPTVLDESLSIAIPGRDAAPWGESMAQNLVDLAQHFSSASAPSAPVIGQVWYNTTLNELNLLTPAGWTVIASGIAGSNTVYRHTQTTPSTSWVISHGLNLVSPYVAIIQIFKDVGAGVHKAVFTDVTFTDSNHCTVDFTNAETGVVLIKK